MHTIRWLAGWALVGVVMGGPGVGAVGADQAAREGFQRAYNQRNYKDAYEDFRKLALDKEDEPARVGEDLQMATQCLQQLNRVNEIDAFREAVI